MKYLLDSNIFIQAKNIQYPFDVFPGFWNWLERDMSVGLVNSIEPVYMELTKVKDDLQEWVSKYKNTGCFLRVDDLATQNAYKEVIDWVYSEDSQFNEAAKSEFLAVADSWLVAKAMASDSSIVTLEKFEPNSKKKIKIPNVCNRFNVRYLNTVELLRTMGIKFSLNK